MNTPSYTPTMEKKMENDVDTLGLFEGYVGFWGVGLTGGNGESNGKENGRMQWKLGTPKMAR